MQGQFGDVTIELGGDHVAVAEIHRPPNNFVDLALLRSLADAYAALDGEPGCRAIVLCSEGKHFCAGANLGARRTVEPAPVEPAPVEPAGSFYDEVVRLFSFSTPVVAAVQGAAVGGGLGLACSADFRVAAPEARFSSNFTRLGYHHNFGLTATLPPIVGHQHALELFYLGRRVPGEEAFRMGLCDRLAPLAELRSVAHAFAAEIAVSGPLAIPATRRTMRGHLAEAVAAACDLERAAQGSLRDSADFAEGIRADAERRVPRFVGR